jgi:hypothetical protein
LDLRPKLEIPGDAGQSGEPERDGAVGEHRDNRALCGYAERDEGADHPALDAPDASREGQEVSEGAKEIALNQNGDGDNGAKGVEADSEHGNVESPVGHRPQETKTPLPHEISRGSHPTAERGRRLGEPRRDPSLNPGAIREPSEPLLDVARHQRQADDRYRHDGRDRGRSQGDRH